MEADRPIARQIQDGLGDDNRHEGENGQIGIERLEMLERARLFFERRRLRQRKAQLERFGSERVRPARGWVWRCEHVDDFVAVLEERLERPFCERSLSEQSDAQGTDLRDWRITLP